LNLASLAGYSSHMRGTIDAMKHLGHEVKLYIAGGVQLSKGNKKQSKYSKWLKQCIPSWIKESWKVHRLFQINKNQEKELHDSIKTFQPDLRYERGAYLMDAGVMIASVLGVKHYLEVNAPFIQEKKRKGRLFIFSEKSRKN
jgi:hypothetical protein